MGSLSHGISHFGGATGVGLDLPRVLSWPLPHKIPRVRPTTIINLLLLLAPLSPLEKQVLQLNALDTPGPLGIPQSLVHVCKYSTPE